jgi:endonuclease-3
MPSLAPTESDWGSAHRLRQRRGRRLTDRLEAVADALAAEYGRPRRRLSDPLDVLIATVLSQNTSDANSTRAFASLESTFASWEDAAVARPEALERAIRSGGLARTKARRIRAILRAVREREGRLDLSALRGLGPEAAEARLRGLPGVGPKTRACVLLFGCGLPAFPVDTHVHRVVRRLGLVGDRVSAEAAHEALAPAVPRGRALELHLNLIRLGRELCRPRSPDCAACPLRRKCLDSRSKA